MRKSKFTFEHILYSSIKKKYTALHADLTENQTEQKHGFGAHLTLHLNSGFKLTAGIFL